MKVLKGFVTINQYINNTPNTTSRLGELASIGMTYSREIGEYTDPNIPGYRLLSFVSTDNNVNVSVQADIVELILNVVSSSVVYGNNHIRPYDVQDFLNNLSQNYYLPNLAVGDFIDNGVISLPEWIAWENTLDDSRVKIWLANDSFLDQYDSYEIEIIPPVNDLDSLFGVYGALVNTLNALTITQLVSAMNIVKANNPETVYKIASYDLVNTINPAQKHKVDWGVLIYGRAGDNIDTIKDALIDYILSHSTHTSSQWTALFPEIFTRTEFVILPRWDKVSIANLTVMSSLYSSILNTKECVDFAKTNINFYDSLYIEDNLSLIPFDYKGITLAVIDGPNNLPESSDINMIFGDYIPVNSSSLDFSRMSIKTQNWLLAMEELIILTETATENTAVPNQFRRLSRGGVLFVSLLYDNVNYLVATKSNSFYSS